MVCYNVKFTDDTVRQTGAAGAHKVTKAATYCKWSMDDMKKYLLQFYMSPAAGSIKQFCKDTLVGTGIPESTFGKYWKKSRLKGMQELNNDFEMAKVAIERFISDNKKNVTNRSIAASKSHRFLTEQEEESIVHICLTMGKAGQGVGRDELLDMINEVVNKDVDEREREVATDKVVREILGRHPDLMKLVNSGSLDPLRAKKANKKTRDTVFMKLQAQTRGLYAQGLIPWKNYCDVPSNSIYNMDEVGTDTTKHRQKIIADKRTIARLFTVTPEGDRMKGHITACITTRADGTFDCRCRGWLLSWLVVVWLLSWLVVVFCVSVLTFFVYLFLREIPKWRNERRLRTSFDPHRRYKNG
jgi:hypothetical protein